MTIGSAFDLAKAMYVFTKILNRLHARVQSIFSIMLQCKFNKFELFSPTQPN